MQLVFYEPTNSICNIYLSKITGMIFKSSNMQKEWGQKGQKFKKLIIGWI